MKRVLSAILIACVTAFSAFAQQTEKKLVSPASDEFNPHWFMQFQAGAAYSHGEAAFGKLISPAAQITAGYNFTPSVGLRLAVSGWEGKNQYQPSTPYKWYYVQPSIDFMLNLCNLGGWKPNRIFNAVLFVGPAMPITFGNGQAVDADKAGKFDFEKLWDGTKVLWGVRGGVDFDFNVSKRVALGIELNANGLSDKFNSKKGIGDNLDWQFNALVGVKIALGKTVKHHDAVYEDVPVAQPAPAPKPEKKAEPKPEPKPEPAPVVKAEPVQAYVFFELNKTEIRSSEKAELTKLVKFLSENADANIAITGYADKQTGNPAINTRLSKGRAEAVKAYLVKEGVAESRIAIDYKGDTVQPFEESVKNRVAIAITK